VFCGSSLGRLPAYAAAAQELGQGLATRGAGVIYGGASIGLMGRLADAALRAGGKVQGVLPESLRERELAHPQLTELRVTPDLATRKTEMLRLADAFVVLPGGIGTLDELFEIWTLQQLGAPRKPMVLINLDGYFDPLLRFVERCVSEEFMRREILQLLRVVATPAAAIDALLTP
jgi:hypothetical protein